MATHQAPEVRRAQILGAALRCFGEKGFHGSKIDDISHACGLSKGAIYWHFESKEEIFLALFDGFDEEIFRAWEALEGRSALETLRAACEIALFRLLETRELLETWTEFLSHPKVRGRFARIYARSRARIAETVARGIEAGELRPCEPEAIAAMLTALVEGLLLQALADPAYDARAAWPSSWAVVSRGLAAD